VIAPENLRLVHSQPEAFCKGPLHAALSSEEREHLQELIVQRYLHRVGIKPWVRPREEKTKGH
jgi:hypothetical protein